MPLGVAGTTSRYYSTWISKILGMLVFAAFGFKFLLNFSSIGAIVNFSSSQTVLSVQDYVNNYRLNLKNFVSLTDRMLSLSISGIGNYQNCSQIGEHLDLKYSSDTGDNITHSCHLKNNTYIFYMSLK